MAWRPGLPLAVVALVLVAHRAHQRRLVRPDPATLNRTAGFVKTGTLQRAPGSLRSRPGPTSPGSASCCSASPCVVALAATYCRNRAAVAGSPRSSASSALVVDLLLAARDLRDGRAPGRRRSSARCGRTSAPAAGCSSRLGVRDDPGACRRAGRHAASPRTVGHAARRRPRASASCAASRAPHHVRLVGRLAVGPPARDRDRAVLPADADRRLAERRSSPRSASTCCSPSGSTSSSAGPACSTSATSRSTRSARTPRPTSPASLPVKPPSLAAPLAAVGDPVRDRRLPDRRRPARRAHAAAAR